MGLNERQKGKKNKNLIILVSTFPDNNAVTCLPFCSPQKHTFLHIITQSCLTISRLEDGTLGPTVEYCNNSPLQAWILHNFTRVEVARRLYFNPTDYFL